MNYFYRIILAGLIVFGLAGCSGDKARLADGSEFDFSSLKGNWMVINYWAEWCAPCRDEIPELNQLHLEGLASGEVKVFGVNFDGLDEIALSAAIERMDIEFPVFVEDPRKRWIETEFQGLPATLIIDPENTLHRLLIGAQTREEIWHQIK